jgi:hypothetical protein
MLKHPKRILLVQVKIPKIASATSAVKFAKNRLNAQSLLYLLILTSRAHVATIQVVNLVIS